MRATNKLSASAIAKTKFEPGRISDGGGLYLMISRTLSKSWVFMFNRAGRRIEIGLGPYPAITLAAAREVAASYRTIVASGGDPLAEKRKAAPPTFLECANEYLETFASRWKAKSVEARWRSILKNYATDLNSRAVPEIEAHHVVKVLRPLWKAMPATAQFLRNMIERVLNYAKSKGHRTGENPATWKGNLEYQMPAQSTPTKHHAAMPYSDVPGFVKALRQKDNRTARAFEFMILTATRQAEAREAVWSEVDFGTCIWTIPAERMKAGVEHRVPLTKRALEMLRRQHEITGGEGYIFPGRSEGRPVSHTAFKQCMGKMKVPQFTPHGFRSSFRDWAGDKTTHAREICEAALAHAIGNAVERAYRKGDAIERRGALMKDWADYLG